MDRPFAWIGIVLLALWLVLIVDKTVPYDLASHGLKPRRLAGLPGIITMPFLHGGFRHLMGNSISLGILLALLSGSQKHARQLAAVTALSGGCLLWMIGRDANHIGASGWIFGLVGLMIGLGYFDRRVVPVLVAIAVGVLFGTTILYGLIPGGDGVSWDGHACGFIAGIAVAVFYGRLLSRRK